MEPEIQDMNSIEFQSTQGGDNNEIISETVDKLPTKDIPLDKGKRAAVWNHYKIFMKNSTKYATCKHCGKATYRSDGRSGTFNHINHLKVCLPYKERQMVEGDEKFDQQIYCAMWAEAIMCHAYPLMIVEHEKLRRILKYLNPNVVHVSRNTILKHCILEHSKYKAILFKLLADLPSRISLTCDLWSACTSRGYLVLTAHYITRSWKLQSKVLCFRYCPPPHTGRELTKFVLGLIGEWGLKRKVFSITCDNASVMDLMVRELKSDLQKVSSLPCDGKYFHVRCSAHILNLIVQSGMKLIGESVTKLRDTVKYIEYSDSRLTRFESCVQESGCFFSGKLKLDCVTHWNSTYLMLRRCLEAKEGICRFATHEVGFDISLDENEWEEIENVCDFLEPFYDITCLFSGSDYPTANLYFYKIVQIEQLLVSAHDDPTGCIRNMAASMFEKFNAYWENYSSILSVAVMLDPRYKLQFVVDSYGQLYADPFERDSKVGAAYAAFTDIYTYYDSLSVTNPSSQPTSTSQTAISARPRPFKMPNLQKEFGANVAAGRGIKGDVDAYLKSVVPVLNELEFNILEYWKCQEYVNPILSSMAKDILAIPITSVASESCFSMGGRILTKYRSRLLSMNVEAFVTGQNWIKGYDDELEEEEFIEMANEIASVESIESVSSAPLL